MERPTKIEFKSQGQILKERRKKREDIMNRLHNSHDKVDKHIDDLESMMILEDQRYASRHQELNKREIFFNGLIVGLFIGVTFAVLMIECVFK